MNYNKFKMKNNLILFSLALIGFLIFGTVMSFNVHAFAPAGCYERPVKNSDVYTHLSDSECDGQKDINNNVIDLKGSNCYLKGMNGTAVTWETTDCSLIGVISSQPANNSGGSGDALIAANLRPDTKCTSEKNDKFLAVIPKWYEYLPYGRSQITHKCELATNFIDKNNALNLSSLLPIGLAVADGLLRISGIIAVVYVIYGAARFIMSQGEPENTRVATQAIINAVIGLAIILFAAVIVAFIGSKFGG
ncbi:MAG: hypothetical protein NVSMB46_09520 [Candidatus Saccharimonadales bacterium]